ncbi:MAG: type IX secretion system outer membrane channel protein PorV [Bacteroidia bacterium]|nr:type IX secretion system outer membrane channel protein PorV [Bacteroidia bacterium]
MRKTIAIAACLILAGSYGSTLLAQGGSSGQRGTKTITTAVPFLLVAPDSRYGGMGETGVAIADDPNAMHWNPAGLGFMQNQMGFSMSYSPWLRALGIPDINLMYLSGYYNTGNSGVIGASLRYFSLGIIQFTDEIGTPIGNGKPNEFALDVGYSLKVTPVLSAAITMRFFNSQLASNANIQDPNARPVTSFAGDVGFLYRKEFRAGANRSPVEFSSGLTLSNIGPKVSYTASTATRDFIPINMRLGYAFKFFLDEYNTVTFANDFNKLLVPSEGGRSDKALLAGMFGSFADAPDGFSEELSEINISAGLEYWYRGLFAARGGFFYEPAEKGNRKFITLGAGLKYNVFGLNFSYLAPLVQNHPLQNTLRFSLTYDFAPVSGE